MTKRLTTAIARSRESSVQAARACSPAVEEGERTTASTLQDVRVLLIEDDPSLAASVAWWLEDRGAQVSAVDSGTRALADFGTARWDLVVSDIQLPDGSGLSLISEFKERQRDVPVLVMTAHERVDWAIDAIRLKVDDFVVKPLAETTFVARVQNLIEASRRSTSVESVLAVGAHPDDVEIGCGGALLAHREAGHRITILTLSAGAVGGPADQRSIESQRAADRLGAELILGDLADTRITGGRPTIAWIESAIEAASALVIYTHTEADNHQDHRGTHQATRVAARPVQNVFCYQSPSTTVGFRPGRFIDVTDHLDEKIEVLGEFATQVSSRRYLTPEMIRSTATYWWRFNGYRPVEPLEVLKAC
ncbi:MAG: response regulator [Acidobacteriota bacterium]